MTTRVADPMDRAFKAYFRSGGEYAPIPANTSYIRTHEDRTFAVLQNCNGILAVYRVRPDRMRRLQRWPKAIESW